MASIDVEDIRLFYPVFANLQSDGPPTNGSGSIASRFRAFVRAPSYVEALKGVSFSLRSGDRLGIVGRNGSGKSTLLRVLGGIYEPSAGRVRVEGDVASLFSIGLGTRHDSTGRQNIILRGLMRGLTRREAEAQVPAIAEFSGLGDFIELPVRTYSQGMAMRLAFATATSFSPEILLLDEWIGAGDAEFQDKARTRMKELVGSAGITVIASHNRSLLRKVCSLGLWLDRGEVRAFGPIDDVYAELDAAKAQGKTLRDGQEVKRIVRQG